MTRNRLPPQTPVPSGRIVWLLAGWIALGVFATPEPAGAETGAARLTCVRQARAELEQQFHERLESLAQRCEQLELPEQAEATRRFILPDSADRSYFHVPGEDPWQREAAAERLVRLWHDRFHEHRREYADALFSLAEEAAAAGDETSSYTWLHDVLRAEPDHAAARRILGLPRRPRGGIGSIQSRPGRSRHAQFGWPARRHWFVTSEHFHITTSHSPAAGRELAEKLEALLCVWRQLFYRYWSRPGALQQRFQGEDVPLGAAPTYEVVLFQDRDEYVRQVGRIEPRVAMSVGYYALHHRRAFFYTSEDVQPEATWYHEVTHQLFQESIDAVTDVGGSSNFWIVEGIALYMESLTSHGHIWSVGGFEANRLQYARYRALRERYYLPLDSLVQLGQAELQQHDDIRRLYTQSAGLAHLLMDAEHGRYRDAVLDYLLSVYQGNDGRDSLAGFLQRPLEEIDRQYLEFLNVTDDQVAEMPHPERLENLCLAMTDVTDAVMPVVGQAINLKWLDLTGTQITDDGLQELAQLRRLQQLSLEQTAITDRALQTVAKFGSLEELDLSHTRISDAGLQQLAPLRDLRTLWLMGTGVSEAGLAHLEQLPKLEFVDLR